MTVVSAHLTALHRTRMFTANILISLLYVTSLWVHCARNDTDASEEFVRKCCLRDFDVIDDRQTRCDLETFNHTSAVLFYRSFGNTSDVLCCSVCSENTFDLTVDPKETTTTRQRENSEGKANPGRTCFQKCISDGRSIRIRQKGKKNGARNDSNADDEDRGDYKDEDEDEDVDEEEEEEEEEDAAGKGEEKEEDVENANDSFVRSSNKTGNCDSIFKSLNFWGANMVVFANIVYIVPYTVVVTVYLTVVRSTRAYHKAVVCYNATQIVLNGIIIGIGSCVLCHVSICTNVYAILGLTIMFLTISTTSWLFVICIDMTLVITRFRWTSSNNTSQQQEEKEKFVTYAGWTWGGSLLATAIAGIAELSPLLPISSPARPNFSRFNDGANLAVILYVMTIPAVTCIANTVLFCYTSYKMIIIRKSTRLATENGNFKLNTVKTRYCIFVKLYLLMDAPWFTSALAAAYPDLWLLKFLRMIQPILMLCAILPAGTASRAVASIRSFWKRNREPRIDPAPPTP